jgi:hypothetical protein
MFKDTFSYLCSHKFRVDIPMKCVWSVVKHLSTHRPAIALTNRLQVVWLFFFSFAFSFPSLLKSIDRALSNWRSQQRWSKRDERF